MRYWVDRAGVTYIESEDDHSDTMNELYVQRPSPNGECYRWDWALWEWVVDIEFSKKEVSRRLTENQEAVLSFKGHPVKFSDYVSMVGLHTAVIEAQKEGATDWVTLNAEGDYLTLTPAEVIELHTALHRYNQDTIINFRDVLKAIDEGTSPLDVVATGWPNTVIVPVEPPVEPEPETPVE